MSSILGIGELPPPDTAPKLDSIYQVSEKFLNELRLWLEMYPSATPLEQILGVSSWQPYTPAWTATGTQPSLGNGTIVGRWTQIGKTIMGYLNLVAGSTTTFGTGNFRFSLPGTIATTMRGGIGVADCIDTSLGNAYIGQSNLVSGTIFEIWTPQSPIGVWQAGGSATPFVWATGDELRAKFLYESL